MSSTYSKFKAIGVAGTVTGTDVVLLAACARDARLTRICVASIRYFYPDVPIQMLPGDRLQTGLAEELKRFWNVDIAEIPQGDYGWGMVKLEALFLAAGLKFLVADVDTIFTGRVLHRRAKSDAEFFVDNEQLSDADYKRLYYDWDQIKSMDPNVLPARNAFNPGQWFGTAGLVTRGELERWMEWSMPRRVRYPDRFMGGDQGTMIYVLLQKEHRGEVTIERTRLMRWPGYGMQDIPVSSVASGEAPALIVHWAGMKKILLRNMVGADLLRFFEAYYYARLPCRRLRLTLDIARHVTIQVLYRLMTPWKLRLRHLRSIIRDGIERSHRSREGAANVSNANK